MTERGGRPPPHTPQGINGKEKEMKVLKCIMKWFVFSFTGKGEVGREAVDEVLVDYSGQGRDKYGN